MSERIVSALAEMKQLYLESVYNNDPKEKQLQEEMRQVYEFKKPQLDPVGKEDGDVDNDGDKDKTDDYLLNRRGVRTSAIESNRLSKEILKAIKNWKGEPGTHNSQESTANVEKIMKSIQGLRPPVAESTYYSWRDTVDESVIWEILDNEEEQKQVKENSKINNYSKKNPVVTVNPEFNTESSIIDSEELTEEFVDAAIDIASQYFYEEGLNEDGIQILMDELGAEEFYEWVMEIGYEAMLYEETLQGELLTSKGEARKKPEVSRRAGAASVVKHTPSTSEPEKRETVKVSPGQQEINFSAPKKTKPTKPRARGFTPDTTPRPRRTPTGVAAAKQAKQQEKQAAFRARNTQAQRAKGIPQAGEMLGRPSMSSSGRVRQSTEPDNREGRKTRKRGAAMEIAKQTQQSSSTGDLLGQTGQAVKKVGQLAAAFGSGMREPFETKAGRDLQATLIRGFRKTIRGARDAAAREVARRRVGIREEFEFWVNDLLDEGYDLSEYTWDDLYEEFEYLQEKAVSEQQQKIFGLALSVKRGETPRSQVSDEVLKIVDSMSEKHIRKYAKTPHKDVPKTVDESYLVDKVINFVRENKI